MVICFLCIVFRPFVYSYIIAQKGGFFNVRLDKKRFQCYLCRELITVKRGNHPVREYPIYLDCAAAMPPDAEVLEY